jgi:hypothetical protein
MKFFLCATAVLAIVLAAVAFLANDSTSAAPMSSGSDDSSMKTLKIE